jgi:ComF family protein
MWKVDQLLATVLPRRCAFCNATCGGRAACPGCEADLPRLDASRPADAWPTGTRPAGTRVYAALSYEYPVDRLVTAAKFHRQLHAARTLGELLALHLDRVRAGAPPELLVPVPLHRQRLARRGYNQAVEIARPLAALSGARLEPALCARIRATPEQSGLPAAARRRNLRGAFAARGRCDGARVAIVDDVVTTGSTAAALARALREAGAASVEVWAAARAL